MNWQNCNVFILNYLNCSVRVKLDQCSCNMFDRDQDSCWRAGSSDGKLWTTRWWRSQCSHPPWPLPDPASPPHPAAAALGAVVAGGTATWPVTWRLRCIVLVYKRARPISQASETGAVRTRWPPHSSSSYSVSAWVRHLMIRCLGKSKLIRYIVEKKNRQCYFVSVGSILHF